MQAEERGEDWSAMRTPPSGTESGSHSNPELNFDRTEFWISQPFQSSDDLWHPKDEGPLVVPKCDLIGFDRLDDEAFDLGANPDLGTVDLGERIR